LPQSSMRLPSRVVEKEMRPGKSCAQPAAFSILPRVRKGG
jgi:hypothetical protein